MSAHLTAVPDVADTPGADDPIELLGRVILSRYLAATKSQLLSSVNVTSRALSLYGRTGIPRNGKLMRAPHAKLPSNRFPTGETALRGAGLTQDELRAHFSALEHTSGIFAALDSDLLDAFFPRALWPVLTTMLHDGPGGAAERAERAVDAYAQQRVPANKRRRDGPHARGTVLTMRDAYLRLFRTIVWLQRREFQCEALRPWTAVPPLRMPLADAASGLDTQGPRPELLRHRWAEQTAEIRRRLRVAPGEDELAALERLPASCLLHRGLFGLLRDRVVLGLMVVTAGRRKAIADLRLSDYVREHIGPAPDYRVSPVLLLRPRKSLPANIVRPKPIPIEFAEMLDVYLAFLRRAAAVRKSDQPHRRPHLRPEAIPDDFPLIVSGAATFRALGAHGLGILCSGIMPSGKANGCGGRRPLIVRESGMNADLSPEQREWVGYNATAYRHTGSQLAERAGELWEKEHPAGGSRAQIPPALYASALQDQKPPGDPLRATYGDKNVESAYEILSGRAIEGIWRLLTTREGARKRINADAYARAWRRCRELERELASIRERADRIYREAGPLGSVRRQLAYLTSAMKLLVQTLDYATRLGEELAREEARLKDLRYDERLWECVPDDAAPRSDYVDIEKLEQELARVSPDDADEGCPPPVRDWLTAREFAEVRGIGARSTVARWLNGQNLPARRQDRPWEREAIPVDDSLGANYRRIWVGGVNPAFWRTELIEARRDACLAKWPREQGWRDGNEPARRCLAPLALPSSMSAPA